MTERLHFHFSLSCIGEGNGNPLQCSCLENPRDGGACWAAVYGVARSRTQLKGLSSSSSSQVSRVLPETLGAWFYHRTWPWDLDFHGVSSTQLFFVEGHAYAEATNIKVAAVTGKAYGTAFMALAGKGSITQSYPTLCDPMDCSLPGSSVHGTLQQEYWSGLPFPSPSTHNAMLCYAKSLQSCPTLCDPIDGCPPGSPVPGFVQARTLEWVAISFSNA